MDYTDNQQAYIRDSQKLAEALLTQRDISYILDVAYEIFDNPIFILDSGFKLVARSKNNVDDAIWKDLSESGYYSYTNLKHSKLDKRYSTIMNSNSTIFVNVKGKEDGSKTESSLSGDCRILNISNDVLTHSRIVSNIYDRHTRVGSVTIIGSHSEFKPHHMKLAGFLSKIILTQMKQSPFFHINRNAPFSSVIMDLINKNIQNKAVLKERLEMLSIKLKPFFCVFTVRLKNCEADSKDLYPLETALADIFGTGASIIYNDSIVFLPNGNSSPLLSKASRSLLEGLLEENQLCCGVSFPFKNLMDIKKYYDQSVKAIKLGLEFYPNKALYYYEQCTLLEIIEAVSHQYDNIFDFCHPAVLDMARHDDRYNTDYMNTLYVYLNNYNNPQLAASVLKIHRNSLTYRLNKIEEIFDLDLTCMETVYHLYISFVIIKNFGDNVLSDTATE